MPTEGEATPAGDATSTSSSAAQFALEGRANATELLKDAADAQTALKQGGTFRLITNGAEMSFNLGQLQALTPPKRAAGEWNDAMSTLEDAVTHYTKAIEGDSVSKIAKAIDEIKVAARTARRIAEQTAP